MELSTCRARRALSTRVCHWIMALVSWAIGPSTALLCYQIDSILYWALSKHRTLSSLIILIHLFYHYTRHIISYLLLSQRDIRKPLWERDNKWTCYLARSHGCEWESETQLCDGNLQRHPLSIIVIRSHFI